MITRGNIALRAVEEQDLKTLRDWRNQPHFRKNFREVRELNLFNQSAWFTKMNQSANDFMFTILDRQSEKPVGAGGLLYIDWIIRSADFSIYIGENEEYLSADGYGSDAALALIDYGFNILNLNKIWMELYEFDRAKIHFFTEVLKFKIDGKLRQNCFYECKYFDSYIISILAHEFRS